MCRAMIVILLIALDASTHAEGNVSFTIEAIHLRQKITKSAPWHEDDPSDGPWVDFDAKTTHGTPFILGLSHPRWYDAEPPDEMVDVIVAFRNVADLNAFIAEIDPTAQPVDAASSLAAKSTTGWWTAGHGGWSVIDLREARPGKRAASLTLRYSLATPTGSFTWKTPADSARLVRTLINSATR